LSEWKDVGRPGVLGSRRDAMFWKWDELYGQGNWRLVWAVGGMKIDFLGACILYEDAYFNFLRNNRLICRQLVDEASNVYDDNPSNIESVFDYRFQETDRTHIQDIAIRRCLLRMGHWFKGDKLIQIRSDAGHPLSKILSPGNVPFHKNGLIFNPQLSGWWKLYSVESFYQSNKVLQISA